ncbi:MAG: tRNA uridine(34) 5-carboxymethylaminomethyl modification radical SAM/GNAT enzyme Elp3 [Candidatus Omnitrophica bacterium CG11_big_fil_rev_8_21_14_0_20_63_9]|nr:MAG: tRNA uridine(34) 5-carboxymethylaminomethyl modification radical SAM/GNAT enzyme Elp3 [Candidatus Omnitrophica bacterium CG11_big_fil_rev_8_21_14_0_20_63_9]
MLLQDIAAALPESRTHLRKLKTAIAARSGGPLIRNDHLLQRYRAELAQGLRRPNGRLERILTLNSIRSDSGIATVTVITEPYACPGRCVYCPTEARAPKSYLTNEPAVMRALRNDYDPHRQVTERLSTLHETGHATDKVELIIKGGTWSFYPAAYQRHFIQRCFEAANVCAADSLEDAQRANETAKSRLIGITIETRPDYVDGAEILRLRELGVTRVELGVQSLEARVLELIVRDHGVDAVQRATRLLKDAGIKVAYHLMPNLPGATPESDLESARQIFTDEAYQPDTIKLYPCVVIETADLFSWWRQGRYQPYDDDTLLQLLIGIKSLTPPHVRIERVIRDIPSTSIRAGCLVTNLREEAQRRMAAQGLRCRCIRCRQVRSDARGRFTLTRCAYPASGGTEIFLSFEDATTDRLASLLRLRIPSQDHASIPALRGAALVRELHSYGHHLPLLEHSDAAVQHHGFGQRLLQEAERIAREECAMPRMAVIAGVGVREYYRRFGYALQDTYMVKELR